MRNRSVFGPYLQKQHFIVLFPPNYILHCNRLTLNAILHIYYLSYNEFIYLFFNSDYCMCLNMCVCARVRLNECNRNFEQCICISWQLVDSLQLNVARTTYTCASTLLIVLYCYLKSMMFHDMQEIIQCFIKKFS